MSEQMTERANELRLSAFERLHAGEIDEALDLYDQALAAASDDELRELITINKADAMITAERSGPEVQALPAILMRRRNAHHSFLAAYALMYKHRIAGEAKRAIFYGQIASDIATEDDKPLWQLGVLNELGMSYDVDSQFERAIECFERALEIVATLDADSHQHFGHVAIVQNLGYSKLVIGEVAEGLRLIEGILDQIQSSEGLAESYIDLCYGYLEADNLERALHFGEAGLELAADRRQIRNAHYLLGEVAYKLGDQDKAEHHFDELAKFYPDFRHLKSLLYAIDLRSMVNLKL